MSVSKKAIKLYNKLTEPRVWVSGIQNAGKKKQRFFTSTVVTNYFTDQSEAISWLFKMNFFDWGPYVGSL